MIKNLLIKKLNMIKMSQSFNFHYYYYSKSAFDSLTNNSFKEYFQSNYTMTFNHNKKYFSDKSKNSSSKTKPKTTSKKKVSKGKKEEVKRNPKKATIDSENKSNIMIDKLYYMDIDELIKRKSAGNNNSRQNELHESKNINGKKNVNIFNYENDLKIFNSNNIVYLNEKLKNLNEKFDRLNNDTENIGDENLIRIEKEFFSNFQDFEYSNMENIQVLNRKYHRYCFERNFSNFIVICYQLNLNTPLISEISKIYSYNNSIISNNAFNYKAKTDLYSDFIINYFVENPHIDNEYKKFIINEKLSIILKFSNIELFRIFKFASEKFLRDQNLYQKLFHPFNPYDGQQKNVLLKKLNDTISNKLSYIKHGYDSMQNFTFEYRNIIDLNVIKYAKLEANTKEYTFPYMLGKIKYIQLYRSLYEKKEIDLSYNYCNFLLRKFMYKQRILNFLYHFRTYYKFFKYIDDDEFYKFFLTKLNKYLQKNFLSTLDRTELCESYLGINTNFSNYLKYRNFFSNIKHLQDYDPNNSIINKSPSKKNDDGGELQYGNKRIEIEKMFKIKNKGKKNLVKITSEEEKNNKKKKAKKENQTEDEYLHSENIPEIDKKISRRNDEISTDNENSENETQNKNNLKEYKSNLHNNNSNKPNKFNTFSIFEGHQYINFEINNILENVFNLKPLLFLENMIENIKNRLLLKSLEGNDLILIFKIMGLVNLDPNVLKSFNKNIQEYSSNNKYKEINIILSKSKSDISIFLNCYNEYLISAKSQLDYIFSNPMFNQIYDLDTEQRFKPKLQASNENKIHEKNSYCSTQLYGRKSLSEMINHLFFMRLIDMKKGNPNKELFHNILQKIILSIKSMKSFELFDDEYLEETIFSNQYIKAKYEKEMLENGRYKNLTGIQCDFSKQEYFYDVSLLSKDLEDRNKFLLLLLSFTTMSFKKISECDENVNNESFILSNMFYEKNKFLFYDLIKYYDNKENPFSEISKKYFSKIISSLENLIRSKKFKKYLINYEYNTNYKLLGLLDIGMALKINEKFYLIKLTQNINNNLDDYLYSDFYNSIIFNCGFEIIDFEIKELLKENQPIEKLVSEKFENALHIINKNNAN